MKFSEIGMAFAVSSVIGIGVFITFDKMESKSKSEAIIEIHALLKKNMEEAYLEGQRDALTDDIRIEKTDSTWQYTKSPWDNESDLSKVQTLSIGLK